MTDRLTLDDLPPDPDAADGDPGVDWHPRADKTDARDADGNLRDLDDDEVEAHLDKPEAVEQPDGGRDRHLAAEDSTLSDGDRV